MPVSESRKERFKGLLPLRSRREKSPLPPSKPVIGTHAQATEAEQFHDAGTSGEEQGPPADSLWALAFQNLRQEDSDLVDNFQQCLGLDSCGTDDIDPSSPRVEELAVKAIGALRDESDAKTKGDGRLVTVRKHFEQAVKIVIASKDFVTAAASTNPYAALAWTGVSLLLPLLLNPSQENEAAIKCLDYTANLMLVYRWQEKTYLAEPDFREPALRLYTKILEFEAVLMIHMRSNAPKRWAKHVFSAGDWSTRLEAIGQLHSNCREVTDTIAANRTVQWRDEERGWQNKLLEEVCKFNDDESQNIRKLYSNYEADKNINPERITGTCRWFLNHSKFLTWRESPFSNMLWVSADPGCGKSVLAKHLVDRQGEGLSVKSKAPIICYFFFKDGIQDRMYASKALRAFLHQLILQEPRLYELAREDFRTKDKTFLEDFAALWRIFLNMLENIPDHEVVCVLDALDECSTYSRNALMKSLEQLYSSTRLTESSRPTIKFLITSRPEFQTERSFKPLVKLMSEVRLKGEEESESISREIDLVIRHEVQQIGQRMDLSQLDQLQLQENLLNKPHRTYLWLYLTLKNINTRLEFGKADIAAIASSIPEDVEKAYTDILNKSPDRERARKLLHFVLAAVRPLNLGEISIAMTMKEDTDCSRDFESWPTEVWESRIKNICGLFLTVVGSEVYLIHQTAREFLTAKADAHTHDTAQAPTAWRHTFLPHESHLYLVKSCIWYLLLHKTHETALRPVLRSGDWLMLVEAKATFYEYAARNWATHAQFNVRRDPGLLNTIAFRVCDDKSPTFRVWFTMYWNIHYLKWTWCQQFSDFTSGATNLMVASIVGVDAVVEHLLKHSDVDVNHRNEEGGTALLYAAAAGHEFVVRRLLDKEGIQVNLKGGRWRATPLTSAVASGHRPVVKLLLQRNDVQVNLIGHLDSTALLLAIKLGHEAIVGDILERDDVKVNLKSQTVQIDMRDMLSGERKFRALHTAVTFGFKGAVEHLIKRKDLQVNLRDNLDKETALVAAVRNGHEEILHLLLTERSDVDKNLVDTFGKTALACAAYDHHSPMVKRLLEYEDVQVNLPDEEGRSPLSTAAEWGYLDVVEMLLERRDIQVDLPDDKGRTPLDWAIDKERHEVVKLLKERGAHTGPIEVDRGSNCNIQ